MNYHVGNSQMTAAPSPGGPHKTFQGEGDGKNESRKMSRKSRKHHSRRNRQSGRRSRRY